MIRTLALILAVGLMGGCNTQSTPSGKEAAEAARGKTVVQVNDTVLTEADVAIARTRITRSSKNPHQKDGAETSANEETPVESLVKLELEAQQARKLGLDKTPAFQEMMAKMQIQIEAYQRQELSKMLRQHIQSQTKVSEEEIKRYFDENAALFKGEVRVAQILLRDRGALEQAKKDLDKGTSFDVVAAKLFNSKVSSNKKPWETGYLRWVQAPKEWWEPTKGLANGAVTGIIDGPGGRGWILKILDRRENSAVTLETERQYISQVLQLEKAIKAQADLEKELLEKAKIKYTQPKS